MVTSCMSSWLDVPEMEMWLRVGEPCDPKTESMHEMKPDGEKGGPSWTLFTCCFICPGDFFESTGSGIWSLQTWDPIYQPCALTVKPWVNFTLKTDSRYFCTREWPDLWMCTIPPKALWSNSVIQGKTVPNWQINNTKLYFQCEYNWKKM